ncbi:signal transduction histidine kinase [Tumebacillus sp. BK434]|uniref:sensor histidine kinase n=1 Tax=Tumebacillus sp. BK434 TaxID=2512169 RepID=UPI00104BFED5|nr:HAMP domain-containing sensor histidine kinase [Tumebacillus sp. BK434]TCP52347.1 signal transduction histidine kinase [Tumebacillus sp. BK434]
MIKSLYLRIVLTFIGVVLLSLIVSFFISVQLFKTQALEIMQSDMGRVGQQVLRLYDNQREHNLDAYFHNLADLNYYTFLVYSENGAKKTFVPNNGKFSFDIETDVVQKVLHGGVYRSSLEGSVNFRHLAVGLPFQSEGKRYALFLLPAPGQEEMTGHSYLLIVLSIILAVGSLLILIASRFLVRPLVQMTAATKRLAKGDFDVRISYKRRDELGTLADSFNHMAAELQQIEQNRQDFVSNVSHEIQSPLTSIKGFSKALQEDELNRADRLRYLQIIHDESERISRLSENLLRLASLESEHHPYRPQAYALDEGIRQAVIAAEPLWSAKDLDIELDLPAVTLAADPDQLSQVWTNLLANAVKYTPPGGSISLTATLQADTVTVSVQDTGIGIAQEELPKIFERFYKVDKSRDRSLGGNGLGLAIVKKIISIHGGTITVDSTPGSGTTFLVILPKG